ncbi:CBS domain-containing protein [Agarivorans sp. QJM3NY_25]|uniref:CBS domain-containing protein n=1 Tax=Agarivorans sp. QJM3NY_25 TaxID=3421430 RepID=UPI003D7CC04F
MQNLTIKNYMKTQFLSLKLKQNISDVSEKLIVSQQIGAPVVDEQNHLLGWVSEQDCVAQMLQAGYYCEQSALVEDIMNRDVLSVSPAESVLDLAKQMLENKPKNYPVVEAGKLIGLIDRKAVLVALQHHQQQCFVDRK